MAIDDLNTFTDNYLPVDGSPIDAETVNKGPIQNREDLIQLDTEIGDLTSIIDQKSNTYDETKDNDLTNQNDSLVDAISQLRIDLGNKKTLTTTEKNNIVLAINELKTKAYSPSNSLNLLSRYDYLVNGNYSPEAGTVSFIEELDESVLPNKNFASSKPYKVTYVTNSLSTKYNLFEYSASTINIKGYEYVFPNNVNLYYKNTFIDGYIDNKYISTAIDIGSVLTASDATNNTYKIYSNKTQEESIYSLTQAQGLLTNKSSISITIGSIVNNETDLEQDLKDIFNSSSEGYQVFDEIKILDINPGAPKTLLINGTSYPYTITTDGHGIKWTGALPNTSDSISIDIKQLYIEGIQLASNMTNISLSADKTSILINTDLDFSTGEGQYYNYTSGDEFAPIFSYKKVNPRIDAIYIKSNVSKYSAYEWDSMSTYNQGDIITYNGQVYEAQDARADKSTPYINKNMIPNVKTEYWKVLGNNLLGMTLQPEFIYIEGDIDKSYSPVTPDITDDNYYLLCYVQNKYGVNPIILNRRIDNFTMEELKRLQLSVEELRYDMSTIMSVNDLKLIDNSLTKDYFVDSFNDDTLRDSDLEKAHTDSDAEEAFSLQLDGVGNLVPNVTWKTEQFSNTSQEYFTLDKVELDNPIIHQHLITDSKLINEYNVTSPSHVKLSLNPSSYRWIDEKYNTYITYHHWKHDWYHVMKHVNGELVFDNAKIHARDMGKFKNNSEIESIITTPRVVPNFNITLSAPAYSFNAQEDVQITFQGKPFDITQSNADGSLSYSTTIGGFLSGKKEFEVIGLGYPDGNNVYSNGSLSSGTAFIDTVPLYEKITESHRINWDPLAQTFQPQRDFYLSSISTFITAETISPDWNIDIGGTAKAINLMLIFDNSLSSNGDYLESFRKSAKDLIQRYRDLNVQVNIRIVPTTGIGTSEFNFFFTDEWVSVQSVNYIIDRIFSTGTITNYNDVISRAETAWGANQTNYNPSAKNVSVFFSSENTTLSASDATSWETFLTTNNINSYSFGLGSANSTELDKIAYNGELDTDKTSIIYSDLYQLPQGVLDNVVGLNTDPKGFSSNPEYIFPDGKLPEDIVVSLFETTAGYPDFEKPLGNTVIPRGTIIDQSNLTLSGYTKAEFIKPIKLKANTSYAIVFATNYETKLRIQLDGNRNPTPLTGSPNSESGVRLKLRYAELSKSGTDVITSKPTLVAKQPYTNGVLLSSSNEITWTPDQKSDLTLMIKESVFNKTKQIDFTPVDTNTFNSITDIRFNKSVDDINGCSVDFQLTYGGGTLVLPNTLSNVLRIPSTTFDSLSLSSYINNNNVKTSSGYYTSTPVIGQNQSIFFGSVNAKNVYVSKAIDFTDSNDINGTKNGYLKLYIDYNNMTVNDSIKVYYTLDRVIQNDYTKGNYSWIEMNLASNSEGTFYYNVLSEIAANTSLRIKIVLNNDINNTEDRPELKNLRVFLSDIA